MTSTVTSGRPARYTHDRPDSRLLRRVEPPTVITFHAPEIVFGPGSLAEAGSAARRPGSLQPV
jgi:hypothetical protein